MEKEKIISYFRIFDKGERGYISKVELLNGFREYCVAQSIPNLSYDQVVKVFHDMDADGNGRVTFEEFEQFLLSRNDIEEVYKSFTIVALRESLSSRKSGRIDNLIADSDMEERERIRAIFDALSAFLVVHSKR
jgi:hypothetical protein